MRFIIFLLFVFLGLSKSFSQINENQTGAWYMYFYNHQFKDSQFGIQGDFQYRAGGKVRQARVIKNFKQDMKINKKLFNVALEYAA